MKDYVIYYTNLNQLITLSKKNPKKTLKEVCDEFESLIWYEILKEMENSVLKSDLFPETLEKKFYQDYLYQEIARSISGHPGSLGDYLYKSFLKSNYFKNFKKVINSSDK